MPISKVLKDCLEKHVVSFRVIDHPKTDAVNQSPQVVNILLQRLAKPVILKGPAGLVMAIIPASHRIDVAVLRLHLKARLVLASSEDYAHLCSDAGPEAIPPLSNALAIDQVAIDSSLLQGKDVYIEAGGHEALVQISTRDFRRMNTRAKYFRFSRPIIDMSERQYARADLQIYRLWRDATESVNTDGQRPLLEMQRQIEKLTELPAMPEMGLKLLQLRANPNASIPDLSRVVEMDPSLSAQVLKLARSAYYGFGGRIVTVEQAILRVLGFDMVLHMSLGAAIGKSFRVPKEGELGLHAYWRNALYSALACHALARLMPAAARPNLGLAYLCGLLHDFGFLLLGHLFRQEYYILSKVLSENPDQAITEIERHVLGIGHAQIGAWLMNAWGLPEEITAAVREHHNGHYEDSHSTYVWLVQLGECLLSGFGIGTSRPSQCNKQALLARLGIREEDAHEVVNAIIADGVELDNMARQLAA